jgi:Ca2+-binding RTX toxin-like protein
MAGGMGSDVYYVYNVGERIIEAAGEGTGTDTVLASVGYTMGAGQAVEMLRADAGTTGLTLGGNGFNNNIASGGGNDRVTGGDGSDKLAGGVGGDTLSGGAGTDKLTGDIGNDIFLFDSEFIGVTNVDTIADFTAADDVIQPTFRV